MKEDQKAAAVNDPVQGPGESRPSFRVLTGRQPGAWKILIYGAPGIGKSTLATHAEDPFFIDLEGGLDRIDCVKTERLLNHQMFMEALRHFAKSAHKTLVIDTVDAAETLLSDKICSKGGKESLADFGYGKGYELLLGEWSELLKTLSWLQTKGRNIILIGHEIIQKVEDPTSENYDRFTVNLHKKSAALVVAKMDAVFFARHEMILKDRDGTKNKRAIGTGERLLLAQEAPCWVAKNRFDLPSPLPMTPGLFNHLI